MKVGIIDCASGDWTVVKLDDQEFCSGHSISKWDLIDLIKALGHEVVCTEISDEDMQEGNY